jgi:sugar/nucleoside kinase (ribokinase family)
MDFCLWPALPATMVNCTGAGDSMAGGIVWGISRGWDRLVGLPIHVLSPLLSVPRTLCPALRPNPFAPHRPSPPPPHSCSEKWVKAGLCTAKLSVECQLAVSPLVTAPSVEEMIEKIE